MMTPSLRKINNDPDNQHIVLMYEVKLSEGGRRVIKLIKPGMDKFKELDISKSLRLWYHSDQFALSGPGGMQTALAICLELYSTSVAINYHRKFFYDHIAGFAPERLVGILRVAVRDLFVPIRPILPE